MSVDRPTQAADEHDRSPDAENSQESTSPRGGNGGQRTSYETVPGQDPLVIHSVEFMGGMASAGGWRPDSTLPEVAFVGRSNVGKSSLLNRLVRRKAFARVSKTPGRTREINFFNVNDSFIFVDLPGYGYARVAKERKQEWRPLMDEYLRFTRQLRGIVLLLDVRREPSADDLDMLDFLAELEVPVLLAVTKVDKLTRAQLPERMRGLALAVGTDVDQLVAFSAVTGQGRDELGAAVSALVETEAWVRGA
ncbi:MAG: ribosome biogenesis GTP-binding protein YihA/YsxC [Gemmatimonadaceae bacterium]